jgi:hypothetical protein
MKKVSPEAKMEDLRNKMPILGLIADKLQHLQNQMDESENSEITVGYREIENLAGAAHCLLSEVESILFND